MMVQDVIQTLLIKIILKLTKTFTMMVTSPSSDRFPAALLTFSLHAQAVNVTMK
jgi:hypothetical protein